MNILISGGSGFLGSAFSEYLNSSSHTPTNITWLSRNPNQSHPDYVQMMSYDDLQATNNTFDVILNLAGAGIADERWSDERKRQLMQSRLQPTQAIINYIAHTTIKPKLLISGSAIGWYGTQGDTPLDEHSAPKVDFAHKLCEAWEQEASIAIELGVPVVILRTGVVMHPNGGMIAKLLTPFKMGTGGKLGDGKQIMSWISRLDWVRATAFIIDYHTSSASHTNQTTDTKIIYNLTAPNPISNSQFTKTLGEWLNRPTFMTLPAPLLKLMFGEMSTLLINGQKVLPKALLEAGFKFKHPTLKEALEEQS